MKCQDCFWRKNKRKKLKEEQIKCCICKRKRKNCLNYIEDVPLTTLLEKLRNNNNKNENDIIKFHCEVIDSIIAKIRSSVLFREKMEISKFDYDLIFRETYKIVEKFETNAIKKKNFYLSKYILIPAVLYLSCIENNILHTKQKLCNIFNIEKTLMSKYIKKYYRS